MSRPMMVCAGLFLLGAVGCLNDAFLARPSNTVKYTRVVDGAPGVVSTMLEEGFSSVGVSVLVKRQDGDIRLGGQSKSGQIFCVYVRPDKKATASAKSIVTVKWDKQPDEELWASVVEWLANCVSEETDSPKGT